MVYHICRIVTSITRQVTLYLVNHVNILMDRNKVFVLDIYGSLKNYCAKLIQICAQGIFKFYEN